MTPKSIQKVISLFSYLFHPVLIGIYATGLYFLMTERLFTYQEVYLYGIQVTIITFFIPVTLYYLLLSLNKIEGIMTKNPHQRKLPLLIHCILLFVLIKKSLLLEQIPELYFYFFGVILSSTIAFIALYGKLKISLHMVGISSLTIFAIAMSIQNETNWIYTIAFLMVANGVVASARLQAKAHTVKEIIIGAVTGGIAQFLFWPLWL